MTMIFDSNNLIDNQILKQFKKDDLDSITNTNVEYFGINIYSSDERDFDYKIYYRNKPSTDIYFKNVDASIVNYLKSHDMLQYLQVAKDSSIPNLFKYDLNIKNRTTANMLEMFDYFDKNIPLFSKHKEEIINFSKIKSKDGEDYIYFSFQHIGFIFDGNKNILFKAYWTNRISRKTHDYYINFLKNSNIKKFNQLAPIADNIINSCKAYIFMEGIDYSESGAISHKVYVIYPKRVYEGLLTSLPEENKLLKERLLLIKDWNDLHPELSCEGFAIGLDKDNKLNLKLYYSVSDKTDNDDIVKNVHKKKKTFTRYYPVKQIRTTDSIKP